MTDLELNRLCAEAMGWHTGRPANKVVSYAVFACAIIAGNDSGGEDVYDPLHDDAQAMALVKRLRLSLWYRDDLGGWECEPPECQDAAGNIFNGMSKEPNRAIVECVAALSKGAQEG